MFICSFGVIEVICAMTWDYALMGDFLQHVIIICCLGLGIDGRFFTACCHHLLCDDLGLRIDMEILHHHADFLVRKYGQICSTKKSYFSKILCQKVLGFVLIILFVNIFERGGIKELNLNLLNS